MLYIWLWDTLELNLANWNSREKYFRNISTYWKMLKIKRWLLQSGKGFEAQCNNWSGENCSTVRNLVWSRCAEQQQQNWCSMHARSCRFGNLLKSDNFLTENIMTMHNFDCSQKCCERTAICILEENRWDSFFNYDGDWDYNLADASIQTLHFRAFLWPFSVGKHTL